MAVSEADKLERIRKLYDRDEAEQPPARTLNDVPAFYECITPEWLTAVIRTKYPSATVTSYRLGERDSGTTNRRRIFLTYADSSEKYPPSVFCKGAQVLANRITMSAGSAMGEVRFYNEIRHRLPIEAPHAYFAKVEPESFRAIIVLEDMLDGYEFCTYQTPMSRKRAESQVELLATMHGVSYGPDLQREFAGIDTFKDRFHRLDQYHGLERACDNGLYAAEDVMPASLIKRGKEVWPRTLESVERLVQQPLTLNHGDVHLGNWYIRKPDQMGLTDYQNLTIGHWSRDLAYTMSTSLAIDDRRAWEKDLIRLYLEHLPKSGGPKETFDCAWLNYRQQMLSVLAYWTVTLTPSPSMAQDMQTKETTLCFLQRIGQAIEDLETLDAF